MPRRRTNRVGITALLTASAIGLLAGVIGCDQPPVPHHYLVLGGIVLASDPETGEMTVELTNMNAGRFADKRLHCVVNAHSEIYINDRLSDLSQIQLGDAVELIGRRDPARGLESFAVSFAYFNHPEPATVLPAILANGTPPAPATTQPGVEDSK